MIISKLHEITRFRTNLSHASQKNTEYDKHSEKQSQPLK